jgi:2-iminobutanoate/2-iminopropanoate deaminase
MPTPVSNRRNFAARLASLFAGLGVAGALSGSKAQARTQPGPQKLDFEGKPVSGGYITPLIIHNGVIYLAGQGAHSHDPTGVFAMDIDTHTRKVLDNIKTLVEAGGGTMDSILQLTVYLAKMEDFEGMNTVFKTYFPHGGPARTTVAVAALPGQSLVEINCTAVVLNAAKKAV